MNSFRKGTPEFWSLDLKNLNRTMYELKIQISMGDFCHKIDIPLKKDGIMCDFVIDVLGRDAVLLYKWSIPSFINFI